MNVLLSQPWRQIDEKPEASNDFRFNLLTSGFRNCTRNFLD
jgi:hypothetical protein